MPVPDLHAWRARWDSPDQARLGVRPVSVDEHRARIAVDLPYGDERDDDPLFAISAITYVADITALSAVMAHLTDAERPNGTSSLHLNHVLPATSTVTMEAFVSARNDMEAIVDLSGQDEDGQIVLRGLATFSVRPNDRPRE